MNQVTTDIGQKLWNLCNLLRDDGVITDCIERQTLRVQRANVAARPSALACLSIVVRSSLSFPLAPCLPQLGGAAVIRSWATRHSSVPYAEALSPGAPYTLSALRRDVEQVLRQTRPTVVIVPVSFDLHPDHASAGPIVRPLLGDQLRVFSYLVHAREFPEPFFRSEGAALAPPPPFAHLPWRSYALSAATEQKKLAVIRMYRTQRRDPHLYLLTEAFVRRNELFLAGH